MITQERVLEILRESEALLDGHFELRSGLHSGQFFQCANVLRFPWLAEELCVALVAKVHAALGADARIDGVISPALGGILVGHEVARALHVPSVFAEKQNDVLVMRRFTLRPAGSYVVAEDVVTRGGRVQETVDIVKAAGAEVAAIALLVDRSGGKASFEAPTFSLLEMAPVTHEPGACPLCDQGLPLVHPGS